MPAMVSAPFGVTTSPETLLSNMRSTTASAVSSAVAVTTGLDMMS